MRTDHEILLQLVRSGLGDEAFTKQIGREGLKGDVFPSEEGVPDGKSPTDWNSLLDLACSQGISAVAADALSAIPSVGEGTSLDMEANEDIRLEWYGEILLCENDFAQYSAALSKLSAKARKNGLGRILVLKGYSMALDYPVPSHRSFGDMDIFSLDGKSDELDLMLHASDTKATRPGKPLRHSHASYKGYSVENHYRFVGRTILGSRERLESFLRTEALQASRKVEIGGEEVYIPSPDFNAVFLIWHMAGHFLIENVNLRQLADWCCFLRTESAAVDWNKVCRVWQENGMEKIASIINGVCIRYLGLEEALLPAMERNAEDEQRFMDQVMEAEELKTKGIEAVLKYFRRRWNFRVAAGRHWTLAVLEATIGHIRDFFIK